MEFDAILALLTGKFPIVSLILAGLGTLVVLGQAVVLMTPSPKDDEAVAKIFTIPLLGPVLSVIAKFAVIQKK